MPVARRFSWRPRQARSRSFIIHAGDREATAEGKQLAAREQPAAWEQRAAREQGAQYPAFVGSGLPQHALRAGWSHVAATRAAASAAHVVAAARRATAAAVVDLPYASPARPNPLMSNERAPRAPPVLGTCGLLPYAKL